MENDKRADGLAVNNSVIARMVSVAAMEVDGVAGMAKRPVDIKSAFAKDTGSRSVRVRSVDGTMELDVYISVRDNAKLKDVAEAVQRNVKEKVQSMVGNAVSGVNVFVSDIEFSENQAG